MTSLSVPEKWEELSSLRIRIRAENRIARIGVGCLFLGIVLIAIGLAGKHPLHTTGEPDAGRLGNTMEQVRAR